MAHWIALDPGSQVVRVCADADSERLEAVPALAILRGQSLSLYAFGNDALPLAGKTPAGYRLSHPFSAGAVSDFDGGLRFLRALFGELNLSHPNVAIAVQPHLTAEEREALTDLLQTAGAGAVRSVPTPLAVLLGADDAPAEAVQSAGCRVCLDVGAAGARAFALEGGRLLSFRQGDCGGDAFDRAVADGVAKATCVRLNPSSARYIKEAFADAALHAAESLPCFRAVGHTLPGHALPAGLAAVAEVSAEMLSGALETPLSGLATLVTDLLSALSPEQRLKTETEGILPCGGVLNFPGLAEALSARLRLPAHTVPSPEACVIRGIRKALRERLL